MIMRKTIIAVICYIFTVCGLVEVQAQYEIIPETKNFSSETIAEFNKKFEYIIRHGKAPDSLVNKSSVNLFVHVIGPNDSTFPGLQDRPVPGNPMSYSDRLDSGKTMEINAKKFRRGEGKQHKVKLVVTVPGVQDAQGNWQAKPIKWNLGKEHVPSFTEVNYLNERDGYQIIFRYDNGLPPSKDEKSEEHKRIHFDGHFCEPEDENCL